MSGSGKAQSKNAEDNRSYDAAADLAAKKEWTAGKQRIPSPH
jgi:hypothetical protein